MIVLDRVRPRRHRQPARPRSARRARRGAPLPGRAARTSAGGRRSRSPTTVGERQETLVYLSAPGDHAAYEELRAGFTAAVSHELRTPLARLMVAARDARCCRARTTTTLIGQARARGRANRRADRRRALPQRARERTGGRRARRDQGAARHSRRSSPSSAERADAQASTLVVECTASSSCRCGRGCSGWCSRTWSRTRSATRARARLQGVVQRGRRTASFSGRGRRLRASRKTTCRASSSASTAPTAPARAGARGSDSRS